MSKGRKVALIWIWVAVLLSMQGGGVLGPAPPFPADKLSVLIVEETGDRKDLSPGQLDIIASNGAGSVVDWIGQHGGQRRTLDKDDGTEMEEAWVKAAMSAPRQSVPWVVASNGRTGFSEPLPKDRATLIAKLTPLGGK